MLNEQAETILREDLEQLQIERLQTTLNRVYRNVAFYRQKFDEYKIDIEKIKDIGDLKELPFTTRGDLTKSYPYDMFAVPLKDIVRIHSTSGTTGKPIVVGYTRNDIQNWTEMVARLLYACGLTQQDIIQVAFNYGHFTGGLGFHYGAEKIGASVVPSSSSENFQKQLIIMKDYKVSALASAPGFALTVIQAMEDMGIRKEELFLKRGIFGSEPWGENMRDIIESKLGIDAFDHYGLSEIIGPGVAGECREKNGLHVNEDHLIVEIIDPKTGKQMPDGEQGELVFSTLTKEGIPLIRYRTGDISSIIPGKCPCGRTFRKINRISGRTDDLIIIGGAKIMPSQIGEALLSVEGVEPRYQITIDRKNETDVIEIRVEMNENLFSDEIKNLENWEKNIEVKLRESLDIKAQVKLVEPGSIKREDGKTRYVVDKRNK